eukprot:8878730-Alexandrium_andersonii.AAC.1
MQVLRTAAEIDAVARCVLVLRLGMRLIWSSAAVCRFGSHASSGPVACIMHIPQDVPRSAGLADTCARAASARKSAQTWIFRCRSVLAAVSARCASRG